MLTADEIRNELDRIDKIALEVTRRCDELAEQLRSQLDNDDQEEEEDGKSED